MTTTDELTTLLDRWCEAVAEAEVAPAGSSERIAAEDMALLLSIEIRAAVLRLTGWRDQVEGASESSWDRLSSSRMTADRAWALRRSRT